MRSRFLVGHASARTPTVRFSLRVLSIVVLPVSLAALACVGDPIEPARAPDHPANPNASEVSFVPAGSLSATTPASSAPPPAASAHDHQHMEMK